MYPREVGSVRRTPIAFIGGSAYQPLVIPQRIEDELETIAAKAAAIDDPFEQSLFLLVFVSYLQAFRDVNKRTGRLACNIPLLKNGLAPFSFMDMDKTGYVKGLLAFYELNRVDLIKEAFVDGYVRSADKYDAYAARPKAAVEIEFRRRKEIYAAVRDYVVEKGNGEWTGSAAEFAEKRFAVEDERTLALLVDRVVDIVESLGEGNHIAYGISRDDFEIYTAGPSSGIKPR